MEKKDYSRDGYCYANIRQEKDCSKFMPLLDSAICRYQGTGCTCEYGDELLELN